MSEVTVGSIRTTINFPLAGGIYEALLEKAERERDEALEELAEWKNAAEHVKADHPDEVHCGCVKVLRKLLTDVKREHAEAMEKIVALEKQISGLNRFANERYEEILRVRKERDEAREALKDANESVVTFGVLWAVQYAADRGFPKGHIHATHYDILQKAGARMNDFTRADVEEVAK